MPGSQPQLFQKAAKSAADVVFINLEDAIAPDDKPQARKNIAAISTYLRGAKTLRPSTASTPTTCIATWLDVLEAATVWISWSKVGRGRRPTPWICWPQSKPQAQEAHRLRLIIETALGMQA